MYLSSNPVSLLCISPVPISVFDAHPARSASILLSLWFTARSYSFLSPVLYILLCYIHQQGAYAVESHRWSSRCSQGEKTDIPPLKSRARGRLWLYVVLLAVKSNSECMLRRTSNTTLRRATWQCWGRTWWRHKSLFVIDTHRWVQYRPNHKIIDKENLVAKIIRELRIWLKPRGTFIYTYKMFGLIR